MAFNETIEDDKLQDIPLNIVFVSSASVVSDALDPPQYTDSFIDVVSARNKGGLKAKSEPFCKMCNSDKRPDSLSD